MSERTDKALRLINRMQSLSDKLAKLGKHPDEFATVSDLQNDLHKVRQAFETQINNEGAKVD